MEKIATVLNRYITTQIKSSNVIDESQKEMVVKWSQLQLFLQLKSFVSKLMDNQNKTSENSIEWVEGRVASFKLRYIPQPIEFNKLESILSVKAELQDLFINKKTSLTV